VSALEKTLYDTLAPVLIAPPVVLCIGSDKVTGDCFGPLVGDRLVKNESINSYVYGTLDAPVTALNLLHTLAFIKLKHPSSYILAVDSALGAKTEVGCFRVIADGIYPGSATGKKLPKVGDFSLTATVAGLGNSSSLYGVGLGFVSRLADTASKAIANCVRSLDLSHMNISI